MKKSLNHFNNLNANYERILEVLRKISKEQLLAYQRRQPKRSDLELVSLSLTSEYMGWIVRVTYLDNFLMLFHQRLTAVFIIVEEES